VEYAPGETLRRVRPNGLIKYGGESWCVGEAFSGELVAIRPSSLDGVLSICYGPHAVGEFKPAAHPCRRLPPLAALAPEVVGTHPAAV